MSDRTSVPASKPTTGAPAPASSRADQPTIMAGTPLRISQHDAATIVASGSDALTTAMPNKQDTRITHLEVAGMKDHGTTGSGTHQGEVWGDFVFERLIGRGGMGAVYLGRQASLDRPVAIKVLPAHLSENEGFRQRFQLEAKAVARIQSPHVIQVYAAGSHAGHHYFAMEYVEGEDLAQRLKSGYRPSHAEACGLVLMAARGLAAAGEIGIVHRDIKPGNMMVDRRGVLKLMDFGLVKLAAENHSLTMTGTIMGTVSYFSPEQGRGQTCDQRTDLYALGVVFYELLTGHLPFTGSDATSVIYQHIHVEPTPPRTLEPRIPEAFQAVVLKCLQKKPQDRYQDAGELVADLERLQRGERPAIARGQATLRRGAGVPSSSHGLLIGGLAAVAVAGIAAYLLWPGSKISPRPGGSASAGVPASPPIPRPITGPASTQTASDPVTLLPSASAGVLVRDPVKPPVPVAPPISPVPAISPAVSPTADPAEVIRTLVAGRSYDEARRQIERFAVTAPAAADWAALRRSIDFTEGRERLGQASEALAAGDHDQATRLAVQAQGLMPEAAEPGEILARLAARDGERKQLQRQLAEAESLLLEGQAQRAEELLVRLAEAHAGEDAVHALLRRARTARQHQETLAVAVREQLAKGDQALIRRDYDNALSHFTAGLQLDPSSARAKAGLDEVNKVKEAIAVLRDAVERALTARQLAEAERRLAELRQLAPGSSALILAENQLAASKLKEDEARRLREEEDVRRNLAAKAVLALCDDPAQDVQSLERALAGFIASAGPGRPEQAVIERRIEDRRQRLALTACLVELDRAVLAGDAARIAAVVAEPGFAGDLLALAKQPQLTFATTLGDFARSAAPTTAAAPITGTALVSIRSGFTRYPERTLAWSYDLRLSATGWQIVAARPQTP